METTAQALLKLQSQESVQLVTIARLVLQQLLLQVHRALAMANVLCIISVDRVSESVHHL